MRERMSFMKTYKYFSMFLSLWFVLNRTRQTGWEMILLHWKDFHGEVVQRETRLVYCYGANPLKPRYQQAKRYVIMDGIEKHVCTSAIEPMFDQLLSMSSKRKQREKDSCNAVQPLFRPRT